MMIEEEGCLDQLEKRKSETANAFRNAKVKQHVPGFKQNDGRGKHAHMTTTQEEQKELRRSIRAYRRRILGSRMDGLIGESKGNIKQLGMVELAPESTIE
jgi:hypothetical protein